MAIKMTAPHLVVLPHINFCSDQSIAKLPTGMLKMMPSWLYRQHFAFFPIESPLECARCSLVVKVTDSWLVGYEFESSAAEGLHVEADDAR
ncbi:hypothetical protein TNCV_3740791 [Trichonephila clavipes]|nr:hypothetical protein TNCV_3740791 [Trichonephila clavipes]